MILKNVTAKLEEFRKRYPQAIVIVIDDEGLPLERAESLEYNSSTLFNVISVITTLSTIFENVKLSFLRIKLVNTVLSLYRQERYWILIMERVSPAIKNVAHKGARA